MGGEEKTQVFLRESGINSTQGGCHPRGRLGINVNRNYCSFNKINRETCGKREIIQDAFEMRRGTRICFDDNQCIISVLRDWAVHRRGDRVCKEFALTGINNHSLENVGNKDEKKGGRGSPCCRPFLHWIHGPGKLLRSTRVLCVRRSVSIQASHLSEKPLALKMARKEGQQTESKAFEKSSLIRSEGAFVLAQTCRTSAVYRKFSEIVLPDRKPV